MAISLGIIPSWQFSQNPAINSNINSHLMFPVGMNQLTVQPINNVVPSGDSNLQGLGITMAQYATPGVGVKGLAIFESTWWKNRKWLAFGALGLLGLGAAAIATKVLR